MGKVKDKTKKIVMEANHNAGELSVETNDLRIIQEAITDLSFRMDDITHKRWDEDPTMARLAIAEIKDKVRLIDMAFIPLFTSMDNNSKELEKHLTELFDEIVRERHDV